ncbi:MAG: cytochrome b N-terminal domain-containing protein [Marmoricola sp.]
MDERLGLAGVAETSARSSPTTGRFMLGEIAMWSFVVVLLTGVFLSLWFRPGMVLSNTGSYAPFSEITMSEAYASALDISFDVRAGLLMRQMHHWAATLLLPSMLIHMMRVFVTGAYRKPRELTWLTGGVLVLLGILAGFSGYSLPDDLLSGFRIAHRRRIGQGNTWSGSYMSFFMFGGEFPGGRSFRASSCMLLIPGLILAMIRAC